MASVVGAVECRAAACGRSQADHRLLAFHSQWRAPAVVAVALLTGCTATGLAVLLGMDSLLLANDLWAAALTLSLAMLIGLTAVAAADIAITRTSQPYMPGVVVLTGRILRYENGVWRAERARLACQVRSLWDSRALTGRLAEHFGVPWFGWWERERALSYLSEHGDSGPGRRLTARYPRTGERRPDAMRPGRQAAAGPRTRVIVG